VAVKDGEKSMEKNKSLKNKINLTQN
jgi:hypothetical protein